MFKIHVLPYVDKLLRVSLLTVDTRLSFRLNAMISTYNQAYVIRVRANSSKVVADALLARESSPPAKS